MIHLTSANLWQTFVTQEMITSWVDNALITSNNCFYNIFIILFFLSWLHLIQVVIVNKMSQVR